MAATPINTTQVKITTDTIRKTAGESRLNPIHTDIFPKNSSIEFMDGMPKKKRADA